MPDSTPLLSQSDNTTELIKHRPSLGEAIERFIANFTLAQLAQAVLVSVAWIFDAQQTFISVFTDAEPKWHCTSDVSCNPVSNICQLPKNSWSWDLPANTSIISEWDLECASSLIKGLPASSFFMGCLVGGFILDTLADSSLGRKNMLFVSCLMMSVSSLLTTFSTNLRIYSFLRFINGFGRATVGTCAIALSTELVGKKWRGQVGTIGFFCFTLGFLSLPAIAYINRGSSWRTIYMWTSIPTIFYCILVPFFVLESPRWLFVRGRKEEAMSIIQSISSPNQTSIIMYFNDVSFETQNFDLYSAIKILEEKKWSLRRLVAMMVIGFGIGMVYYGMPLGLGHLSFNLYLNVTFNALSELPSPLITFFLVGKLKRKGSILAFTITSGICNIMCVVMGKTWTSMQIGLELVAFFSGCTGYALLLIYTIELFPTCVRNSAMSMVRQAVVFGGVFSPVLVAAGRENGFLPYGIFGLAIGFCGLFVIALPETRDRPLSDTMEEEAYKVKAGCNNFGDA